MIKLDITKAACFLEKGAVESFEPKVASAQKALEDGTCPGNDFLGWLHLPSSIDEQQLQAIEQTAAILRQECEYVITIGIGGSYLGAKAVIEALSDHFAAYKCGNGPKVVFAGNNIGEDYLYDLMDLVRGHKFGIIVISKSGTTTEPAVAFRIVKDYLDKKYKDSAERIVAITDAKNAIANFSIDIAQKVITEELKDREKQEELVEKWLEDCHFN